MGKKKKVGSEKEKTQTKVGRGKLFQTDSARRGTWARRQDRKKDGGKKAKLRSE